MAISSRIKSSGFDDSVTLGRDSNPKKPGLRLSRFNRARLRSRDLENSLTACVSRVRCEVSKMVDGEESGGCRMSLERQA